MHSDAEEEQTKGGRGSVNTVRQHLGVSALHRMCGNVIATAQQLLGPQDLPPPAFKVKNNVDPRGMFTCHHCVGDVYQGAATLKGRASIIPASHTCLDKHKQGARFI